MALTIFTATAIYKDGQYTFNDPNNLITINAAELDAFSPRNAWVLRTIVPGTNRVEYNITFSPSSADLADVNTIQGIYIEQEGDGVVIDCISITQFNLVANGTGTIQARYGAAPAFTSPTTNYWCITRSDDGSGYAHDRVVMAYIGQYIGNMRLKSNISGTSIYTCQAYGTMVAVGSDSVVIC